MKIFKKTAIGLLFAVFLTILSAGTVRAEETATSTLAAENSNTESVAVEEPTIYTLRLDEATVVKGYTFVAPDNDFKVGVVDKAVTEPVTVRFKKIPDSHMTFPLAKAPGEKASAIWEFDLLANDGSLGKLVRPIYLAIGITNTKMNRKVMYYWDKAGEIWRALPSSLDLENKLLRATIYLPYARLALFDEPDGTTYEALASWYPTNLTARNTLGCASNAYPLNTPLWVCRLDDLTKCTITRVISRGPYVDDRIVDLTKDAFETIGNPRGGVIGVRVFLRK
ncbi:MAG TPA: RlpA-like double-psi beta-barrel domain-containing protein [Patescibacteria group bacterium]|nr:RlpA-like double-psi beta-barrel domain-containing protein [Patescibacteria group bacterium]